MWFLWNQEVIRSDNCLDMVPAEAHDISYSSTGTKNLFEINQDLIPFLWTHNNNRPRIIKKINIAKKDEETPNERLLPIPNECLPPTPNERRLPTPNERMTQIQNDRLLPTPNERLLPIPKGRPASDTERAHATDTERTPADKKMNNPKKYVETKLR